MVNKDLMELLDKLGFGADIDALENYVSDLQNAMADGNPKATDAEYDAHYKLLKQLKPESAVLTRNWEKEDEELDDYDILLREYGMNSITTAESLDDLGKFREAVENIRGNTSLIASLKENGHAIRAVYLNGQLFRGTTRGRYKKGRDITRHMKLLLPNYVKAWDSIDVVEVRGEALVSIPVFEEHLKDTLKHPLSSVTSLIRESATDAEIKLMDVVCYKILLSDDSIKFKTLQDEFNHLNENGFRIPQFAIITDVNGRNLKSSVGKLLEYFEGLMDEGSIQYSCDGIVVAINDSEQFENAGKTGNTRNGNIAIKAGRYWESNIYQSEILEIKFTPGKSYLTPKAYIEPVVTANGSTVTKVPLYNVGVMERYGYVPGETIYFRYGGEQGVTCCDVYGNSVQIMEVQ